MELGPGTILAGKYRFERDLGAGGMGRVIAATHLVLRRPVAVKVLTRTTSPDAARRFLREARLASRLTSDHVPRMLDAGQLDDGVPYIAMELLDGIDLATLAKERGAFAVTEACDYVLQACAGIGEAHALGIVHRDVKLANLFLATTSRGPLVKVLDFGCAKAERTGATSIANPTEDGAWLGTPRSMAPEQLVSSRDVDARADVWALGVVLYTLIAGRPPFDGKLLRILYHQIQNEAPPPITQPLPAGLAAVIDRCLRKNPDERFADARALAVALAPFANGRRAPRAPILTIAAVALAVAAVAVSAVVMAARHTPSPSPSSPPSSVSASASSSVVDTVTTPSVSAPMDPTPTATATSATPTHTIVPSRPIVGATPYEALARAMPTEYPDAKQAHAIAQSFCAQRHVRECCLVSEDKCVAVVERAIPFCHGFSDRVSCLATGVRGPSFKVASVKSKACADFD